MEYDFEAEAKKVCEAIDSKIGRTTVMCALGEAYLAGKQFILDGGFIPLPSGSTCVDCGAQEGIQLKVSKAGWGVAAFTQHKDECPQRRCPHGIVWEEPCAECNMDRAVYADADKGVGLKSDVDF